MSFTYVQTTPMKIAICTSALSTSSKTRGVGAYTRELVAGLRRVFPQDVYIETNGNPYAVAAKIVHYPFFDPYFLTLPWHYPKKTIITIHDLIPLKYRAHFPVGLRGKIIWLLQKMRAQAAAAIITDSHSSAEDIHQIMGIAKERLHVVPLASATARTSYAMSDKLKKLYHLPEKYILYVGDINWNKNVPGLITAFGKTHDKGIHLLLVGKVFSDKPAIPEFQAVMEAIENSTKKDKIHLLGYIPSHHLGGVYHHATLYCQPSWDEGFGLPILEAMKAGCPVVSSNRGSLREVGGEAASYFDPAKDNLAEAIDALLASSKKRTALSEAGLEKVKEFTWEKTAKLTHHVYTHVLTSA